MTTTAKTNSAAPRANIAGITIGGVSEPYRHPVVMPIIRVLSPVTHPRINSAQAVIDARALKIDGISPSFLVLFYASIITLIVNYWLIMIYLPHPAP